MTEMARLKWSRTKVDDFTSLHGNRSSAIHLTMSMMLSNLTTKSLTSIYRNITFQSFFVAQFNNMLFSHYFCIDTFTPTN